MTALKKLKVTLPVTPPENDKPTVPLAGDLVTQYNEASKVLKDAEKLMGKLAPTIKEAALSHLYIFNVNHPTAPITTVAVQDDEGSTANVSFKNAYPKELDEKKALAALDTVGCEDPNLYLVETLKVTFDGSVFVDENGEVRLAYYRAVQAAVQAVAEKFALSNPLDTKKVVALRPTFHEVRFAMWPTVKNQVALTAAFPNQVSLTPVKA